jgi:hypothetical protein
MDLVVSDSSALIHLAAIDRLDLLQALFQRVTVPPAVWREVVEEGGDRAGALEVARARQAGWMRVAQPTDAVLLRLLKRDLDDGEAEAIALSLEQDAKLLLVDETDAREIADLYDLPKTGTIGVLIRAKQVGLVQLLRPELDNLLHQGGFWIAEPLYRRILEAVGELG